MPTHQFSLSLITHKVQDSIVEQRAEDGYINATAMCKAAGKLIADYSRLGTTKDYLEALSDDMGIPISSLVQTMKGTQGAQGTWVHPQVAIHLAQWLSAKFAVQVSRWVHEWMSGKHIPTKLPYHLERHMLNLHKIPTGHFSVLQEMTNALVAPMEARGHRLPEKCMPDISHGKLLCKHLRDKLGINTDALPTYVHEFPDGRRVAAKLYPVEYLGVFRKLLDEFWMPEKAALYFKTRDPAALPVLDQMLMLGKAAALPPANRVTFQRKASPR